MLRWRTIHCLPIVHGRLAFATEARRLLLERSWGSVAVELPPSWRAGVEQALDRLPAASVVLAREQPEFLDPEADCWYVAVHPGDAIVETLRVARSERLRVHYVDAEIEELERRPVTVPDPHALHTLGIEEYTRRCEPILARQPGTGHDALRESHMAARLARLAARSAEPVLFVCGMAHWRGIRRQLVRGEGSLHEGEGPAPELVQVFRPLERSVPFLMGDLPDQVRRYEEHRRGIDLEPFDPSRALKQLLLGARREHARRFPGSLERANARALRTLLDFARKMTVRKGALLPDSYTLTVAAKGTVGNDYALVLLELAQRYPWNADPDEAEEGGAAAGAPNEIAMTDARGLVGDHEVDLHNRAPGSAFEYGRLKLERRPEPERRRAWETNWDPRRQCSWPPEDLVIENFRDYVGQRALSLAKVARERIEEFRGSFLDGLALRETMRDIVERRIYVREEPSVAGAVGALVVIFEEDDFGERYPWRSLWLAEHHNESTLCFYATDFHEDVIGPGVARAHYGGNLLLYPPIPIPNPWEDLRFERARTPSERLLLAAVYWSRERYVAYVGDREPSPEVVAEAQRRGKHVLRLPLSTFGARTLERLRRFHVLNGRVVRSWAARFIR